MALVRKSKPNQSSSAEKKQIIKVSPYENQKNVLDLMASICSAKASSDIEVFWNEIEKGFSKEEGGLSLSSYLTENRSRLYNQDFEHKLKDYCRSLSWSLKERQNTEDTQVVIAGGFSSGKSSFLNQITKCAGLLPTGTDPVSVVKTYLYCSDKINKVSVNGVNLKNVLLDLDTSVLQAIQHTNKSSVYLASVLDMLFVKVPSSKLNGLVFIDTPGYNNTDRVNDSNGKTDRETAIQALQEGNVLFWFVGSDRPTITTDDIKVIEQFNGKKVIIFNKADKHGYEESEKLVVEGSKIIYSKFPKEDIIDVIAYSTLEDKIYYSMNKLSMEQIIDQAKSSGNGKSEMEGLKEAISNLFDTEIQVSIDVVKGTETSEGLEAQYNKAIDDKNEWYKIWQKEKENNRQGGKNLLELVKDIMIDAYTEADSAAIRNHNHAAGAFNNWKDLIVKVDDFNKHDYRGSAERLYKVLNENAATYIEKLEAFNNDRYETLYTEDTRRDVYNAIEYDLKELIELSETRYENACKDCENLQNNIRQEEKLQQKMNAYKQIFLDAINSGIASYTEQHSASIVDEKKEVMNVFDCIEKDDYKQFLHSFEEGVDLTTCNADGYSPLTLAVHNGNNMMVRFLLDHDACPSVLDKRGYNAFHTAVENQYRDICKVLLDIDPELIETKTANGESIEDLVSKQTFKKWIEQKIDNAL